VVDGEVRELIRRRRPQEWVDPRVSATGEVRPQASGGFERVQFRASLTGVDHADQEEDRRAAVGCSRFDGVLTVGLYTGAPEPMTGRDQPVRSSLRGQRTARLRGASTLHEERRHRPGHAG
jgi:hypothetical protein